MDTVMLSRLQFGLSVGFHFLFPATTLGLTLYILMFESFYLKTRRAVYKNCSAFLIKLLALVFVLGTVTGATLEFSFGTNWADYSRFVGDVFGAPVAIEGITSFALEAIFIAVLVFGRQRVRPGTYWLSAFLVFFGAHLSGFWILAANSWMQTPAGFAIENGRAVLTHFGEAILNHSTWVRFGHTILAGWLTGTALVCGIAATYLLRHRHADEARSMLAFGAALFIWLPLAQLLFGHFSALYLDRYQWEKSAALEGIFQTQRGAPLYLFGIPDEDRATIHWPVAIPKMLSLLNAWDTRAEVRGLDQVPREDWPPVNVVFITFHGMVLFGFVLIGVGLAAGVLWLRGRLYTARWFHWVLLGAIPLPYASFELGWVSAEMGRQPWVVYRVLRTLEASSPVVPPGQVLFSLIMLMSVYAVMFSVFLALVLRIIRRGPESAAGGREQAWNL